MLLLQERRKWITIFAVVVPARAGLKQSQDTGILSLLSPPKDHSWILILFMDYNPLLALDTLMLILSQIWPIRVSSSGPVSF